ncbi:MAG: helix-turn-helix transcriptional regulator [Methanobacteriaceae archaeon]|nr:helix-turn-helix transcriptional regulator [Methanobacteriaceae archaeon]
MTLKKIRMEKGLTQEELAIKSKISLSSIVRIERTGKCTITLAQKIANALNVTIDEIFPDNGK